jgi:molecular chaperone DnaK
MNGTDAEAIKAATEKVSEAFYPIAQKMYQDAAPGAEGAQDAGAYQQEQKEDDNVVDADYEVVDDDNDANK